MNELTRIAYLDALGIDSYVSRRQLPGAAVTRRLAIASRPREIASTHGAPSVPATVASPLVQPASVLSKPGSRTRTERKPDPIPQATQRAASVPRFSLVTIVAGDWLWLEDLAGMPLTTEQVQLVQAMARALLVGRALRDARFAPLQPDTARPDVMQFDWPIHANRQLDQGDAAAQAGLAGFLARRLEQHGSRGLVLLGQSGAARVPVGELNIATVSTASSADMLAEPALKRQAWQDLQPLILLR